MEDTPVHDGVRHARNQRIGLHRFLEDWRLPIHNNDSERELRHQAVHIGRSNSQHQATIDTRMLIRLFRVWILLLAVHHGSALAHPAPGGDADPKGLTVPSKPRAELEPVPEPSALATLAAVVPGIAVHGLGHYVAGDKVTAYRLLGWQALGLGLASASGLALGLSGGSRYGNELTIPVLVTGSGLIINTFVADIYGTASGGSNLHYHPRPAQAASLGYGYVRDPLFDYRHFAVTTGTLSLGATRVQPSLWIALDADNQRARLPLAHRILENTRGEYLEFETALTFHDFGDDDFATLVAEISLGVRLDMRRLGRSLRGSFSTASVGGGVQRTSYELDDIGSDTGALMLGHFGYGFYLPRSGELTAYYEHRRDTFTSGISPSSRNGSGFLGHVGLRLHQPITKRFALRAQGELGSAYLLTTGLEVRMGKMP